MKLSLIAALTDEGVIGKDQQLPWRLSEDLKRFKRLTLGHPVIMGRRTWESLPKKPLPERPNLVLSRDAGFRPEGAQAYPSLRAALADPAYINMEAFVIGGAAVFAEALPLAARLHLTLIHHPFPGDVFFPAFDRAQWRESSRESLASPEGWAFDFVDYERL